MAGTISASVLGVGPRWLEKYRRVRSGLKHGPVTSEPSCSAPVIRTNGATSPSVVIITTSMFPPSSAT